jgi:hypothetical protein
MMAALPESVHVCVTIIPLAHVYFEMKLFFFVMVIFSSKFSFYFCAFIN